MDNIRQSNRFITIVAFLSFVVLGLPTGLLNRAWSPPIRETFALSLGDIGVYGFANILGYLLASFVSGRLATKLSLGVFLTGGGALMGIGLFGIALSPIWLILVIFGFVLGLGSGAVDSGLNTYAATNRSSRFMNWLHASYGLGAAVGPLIMSLLLQAQFGWQVGYALVGSAALTIALAFAVTRPRWTVNPVSTSDTSEREHPGMQSTLTLPMVWLMMMFFATYAGVEQSGGQWSFSLFKSRAVDEATAGLWVSVYWGSLTVGRVVFGALSTRVGAYTLLRGCIYGMTAGAVLMWLNVSHEHDFIGLALLGFLQAPIFPIMISRTPHIVGYAHAANSIGFQIAAAGIGLAGMPALAGILAERINMEVVAPFLVITSLIMYALYEIVLRVKRE